MNHNIQPLLDALPAASGTDRLTYVIGDAWAFAGASTDTYDCVYTSSFSPDERRQDRIKQQHNGFLKKAVNYVPKHLLKRSLFPEWPKGEPPVMPELVAMAAKACRDGGLFIRQSHAFGVNVLANSYYSDLLRAQLLASGWRLLRFYCFRSRPTITLLIARKGSEGVREEMTGDLTAFHGRFYDGRGILRLA